MSFGSKLNQLMDPCEACITITTRQLCATLPDEPRLLGRWVEPELKTGLVMLATDSWQSYTRMTYTKTSEVLQQA